MPKVMDIEDFRANLERIVEETGPGESFLLSVNGKPTVEVIGLTRDEAEFPTVESE